MNFNPPFWDELGIAQTSDERAIKRAYATKLKVTSPERDPAGYMKLREAYEAAKQHAEMLRRYAEQREAHGADVDAETDDDDDEQDESPRYSERPAQRETPARQQAYAQLQELLGAQKFEEFLQQVDSIKASATFVSLDGQHDFIGEVAVLVQDQGVDDVEWLARLAARLGAREHDNVFAQGTRYWHAYQDLLDAFSHQRAADSHSHVHEQDELTGRPGYLHVYHVLTGPFDSERLMALTRSRSYHQLAEQILERSARDPAIVIPTENREWWERTAMAGQHRPSDQDAATVTYTPTEKTTSFPWWPIWVILMLIVNGARSCGDRVERASYTEPSRILIETTPSPNRAARLRILSTCDPNTRVAIISHLYEVESKGRAKGGHGATGNDIVAALQRLDENDPVVASLLAKCGTPSRP